MLSQRPRKEVEGWSLGNKKGAGGSVKLQTAGPSPSRPPDLPLDPWAPTCLPELEVTSVAVGFQK